jgi:Bacterial regulatory protein, Fis family
MEAIADALEKTHWCRKDAAKMLGISYKALLYKIRQFGLDTGRPARASSKKDPAAVAGTASTSAVPPDLAPAGKHG